jgi:hypothetical protein
MFYNLIKLAFSAIARKMSRSFFMNGMAACVCVCVLQYFSPHKQLSYVINGGSFWKCKERKFKCADKYGVDNEDDKDGHEECEIQVSCYHMKK